MRRPSQLVLVRHGESEWTAQGRFQGHGDTPLTQHGRRQAAAVGARLAAPPGSAALPVPATAPLAIWHSPLRRAAETAQAIRAARGDDTPAHPLPALVELGQGEWEGLTRIEIEERFPGLLEAWHRDPRRSPAPGSEPFDSGVARATAALDVILARPTFPEATPSGASVIGQDGDGTPVRSETHGRDWSIVVAHEGILRLVVLELLHLTEHHFWVFPFVPAALTILDLDSDMARLRAHNLDEHLSAMNGA